jgi:hypothetical protein
MKLGRIRPRSRTWNTRVIYTKTPRTALKFWICATIRLSALLVALISRQRISRCTFRCTEETLSSRFQLGPGAPGTTKPTLCCKTLRVCPLWLNALCDSLNLHVETLIPNLFAFHFQTSSMSFAQPPPGVLVLDDATQWWPEYISLWWRPTSASLIFISVRLHKADPSSLLLIRSSVQISTAEWLSTLCSYYAPETYRTSDNDSALFGFPALPRQPAVFLCVERSASDLLFRTSCYSWSFPRFATSQAHGTQRCLTFRKGQGSTIDRNAILDLGGLSATSTEKN